jgi:hypothetical protein
MTRLTTRRRAGAIGTTLSLSLAGLTLAALASSEASANIIQVGAITQTSPRPNIQYQGAFGSFISSELVNNGTQRTLVSVDLYGLMQSVGLNYIESISIIDGGNNQYNSSPGADIDYVLLDGLGANVVTTLGYVGPNTPHTLEGNAVLTNRTSLMDAVTGDQDYNSFHFVSLGYMGALTATFTVTGPSGGGGGGGGGSGPGEFEGGGGPGAGTSNLLAVSPGLTLRISEAGLGERYLIQIKGSAVPAPAAGALAALAGLCGSRRRRRR